MKFYFSGNILVMNTSLFCSYLNTVLFKIKLSVQLFKMNLSNYFANLHIYIIWLFFKLASTATFRLLYGGVRKRLKEIDRQWTGSSLDLLFGTF